MSACCLILVVIVLIIGHAIESHHWPSPPPQPHPIGSGREVTFVGVLWVMLHDACSPTAAEVVGTRGDAEIEVPEPFLCLLVSLGMTFETAHRHVPARDVSSQTPHTVGHKQPTQEEESVHTGKAIHNCLGQDVPVALSGKW
ncbi:hypothetical protein E2C01_047764 [Portunus trituberculatus]|uniref:Secreted protein n=1 Tax=Portunus trituberculatus TaxID=210409 RepID=A0A5B7G1X6_PORTR|nr:hypothetical protein [Portunus trituberculatus]